MEREFVLAALADPAGQAVRRALGQPAPEAAAPRVVYLVAIAWWRGWCARCGVPEDVPGLAPAAADGEGGIDLATGGSDSRGPIDNGALLEAGAVPVDGGAALLSLRKGLVDGRDFRLLPPDVWQALHKWCVAGPGLASCLPSIAA
jgi:hypothetical protein